MASKSLDSVDPPGDTANASRRLASILLYQRAQISASRNDTTATAESKGGHSMEVTFWMANPPGMSFFSVYCAKQPDYMERKPNAFFTTMPHVVGAEGRFVCLRAQFDSRYCEDELFMYKAGDSPSLDWVPPPADDKLCERVLKVRVFGIVPCSHDGDHYLLVALCDANDSTSDYQLHIYSSEKKTWNTNILVNPCPIEDETMIPEKVIMLGEGILCWVDLSRGLLICDLHQDPPGVRFIPLPEPSAESREALELLLPGAPARSFRDVACVNGMIKFIEMEYCIEVTEKRGDKDVLSDLDLTMSRKRKYMDVKPKSWDGWRVFTWCRSYSSTCWYKGCTVHVADMFVDESTHSSLLSELRDETVRNLTFRDLCSAYPTLSTDGDDIVYFKSVVKSSDQNGWVVAVDLGNKTVKSLEAYSFKHYNPSKQALYLCTLSRHMSMTPGIEVSAYSRIILPASSANDPTSIDEDKTISPLTKFPRQMKECKRKANAEIRTPLVKPVQNNIPLQRCNTRNYPGYALSAPASNSHAYADYQPLWQHPQPFRQQPQMPPFRQQLQMPPLRQQPSSSVFVTHEVPPQSSRMWDGTRYHGYSQQLSAPTSLPACAAWQPLVQPQQTPWNP